MARFLQQLLDMEEPNFSFGVRQLEEATGKKGLDTGLIADITHSAHDVMRSLGLDTTDSTATEVYRVLCSQVNDDKLRRMLFGMDYVLMAFDGEIVSFNLVDIIENTHHQLDFTNRIISHGQRSLRGEIVNRYIKSGGVDEKRIRGISSDAGLLVESDEGYSRAEETSHEGLPFVLAVGDIFTDAFIELDPDEAVSFTDEKDVKHLMMPFGSKPPYIGSEVVNSVGPSPNAAVSFARLGLQAGLRSFLGDDQTARESLAYLKSEGIDTVLVESQHGMKSNYYYVLRLGADRTILVKNEKYSYSWENPGRTPDWIYLSLLSEDSWRLHEDLVQYLKDNQGVKLAFQPGTFHFKWGVEKLKEVYEHSYIVVMNREEAVDVTGKDYDDLQSLCDGLHALGPKVVVVTDGPSGSCASFEGKLLQVPNYPDSGPPVDRTGAGDAFASTIVAALALGETLETALTWAPINSMSVVQKLGAQSGLLKKEEILKYLEDAPGDYVAKEYKK